MDQQAHPNDTDSGISTTSGNRKGSFIEPVANKLRSVMEKTGFGSSEKISDKDRENGSSLKGRRSRSRSPVKFMKEQFNKIAGLVNDTFLFDTEPKWHTATLHRGLVDDPRVSRVPFHPLGNQRLHPYDGGSSPVVSTLPEKTDRLVTVAASKPDPPPTPPKPKKVFKLKRSQSDDESSTIPRRSAAKKPSNYPESRPIFNYGAPVSSEKSLIDIDLVGGDRYDPASRAFAYVPTASLESHFRNPKAPTRLVPLFEAADGSEAVHPDAPKQSNLSDTLPRDLDRLEDELIVEVDPFKDAGSYSIPRFTEALNVKSPDPADPVASRLVTNSFNRPASLNADMKFLMNETETFQKGSGIDNEATSSRRRKLSDIHQPEVDALLDPGFYLLDPVSSGSTGPDFSGHCKAGFRNAVDRLEATRDISTLPPSARLAATQPVEDIRVPNPYFPESWKAFQPSPRISSPQRSISAATELKSVQTSANPTMESVSPKPVYARVHRENSPYPSIQQAEGVPVGNPTSKTMYEYRRSLNPPKHHHTDWTLNDTLDSLDAAFPQDRSKQTWSAQSSPIVHRRQLDRQTTPLSQYSESDWLDDQLEKLKWRMEENDPYLQRRKAFEKQLLEELRAMHEERKERRNLAEASYSFESIGVKTNNDGEGYAKIDESAASPRRPRHLLSRPESPTPPPVPPPVPPKPVTPIPRYSPPSDSPYGVVTGKPPTPPPGNRDRSRTPPSLRRYSPSFEKNPRITAPASAGCSLARCGSIEESLADLDRALYESQMRRQVRDTPRSIANKNTFDHLQFLVSDSQRPVSLGSAEYNRPNVQTVEPRQIQHSPVRQRHPASPSVSTASTAPASYALDDADYRYIGDSTVTNLPLILSDSYQQIDKYDSSRDRHARVGTPTFPQKTGETPVPFHPLLYSDNPGGYQSDQYYSRPRKTELIRDTGQTSSRRPQSEYARPSSPGSVYSCQTVTSSFKSEPGEVVHHHPNFVRSTSKYWYKPNMSREETINILKNKAPGTFLIRDSNSFPGAFGLAVKVAQPPPGVHAKSADDAELVRHFLIEPTSNGVRLKGCSNEPVFGSLSAMVYQHSITPLALPCRLVFSEYDLLSSRAEMNSTASLLEQGAACNVTYLCSVDCEALTGSEAIRRTISQALMLGSVDVHGPVSVHFKVSALGITLTDNTRQLFFRRHYPAATVIFCGTDPEDRRWTASDAKQSVVSRSMFGFVTRKRSSTAENACHIFAEAEPEQPAAAIVNFVTKVMMQHKPNQQQRQQHPNY